MYYRHYLDRIFIIHRLYKVLHHRFTRTVTDLVYMSSTGAQPGAKLEGGCGGVWGGVTPPKVQIIWIGRANHLDWQGNERF